MPVTTLVAGVKGVSIVLSSLGAGAALSAIWLAYYGAAAVSLKRIYLAFVVFIIACGALFLSSHLFIVVVICLIVGMTGEIHSTGTLSLIQIQVQEEHRGRIMGNLWLLKQIAAGVATYVIGAVAVSGGLKAPMLILAVCCLVIWVLMLFYKGSDDFTI
jgi:predicted MFS family arabinose efflux permease